MRETQVQRITKLWLSEGSALRRTGGQEAWGARAVRLALLGAVPQQAPITHLSPQKRGSTLTMQFSPIAHHSKVFHHLTGAPCAGQVARKVRKYPWEAHEALLVRCLLKALKGHYAQTAVLATCAASLARYHPSLSIHLTDVLLELVSLPWVLHYRGP